jgi:hypothetical protein
VNPVLSEVLAALMAEAAEQQTSQSQPAPKAPQHAGQGQGQGQGPAADSDDRDHRLSEELTAAFAAAARHADAAPETEWAPLAAPVAAGRVDQATHPATPAMTIGPSAAVDTGRRPVYTTPPTMVRVEQIIEELSAITAAPVFGSDRVRGRVARPTAMEHPTPVDAHAADVGRSRDDAGATDAHAPRPKALPTLPPRAGEIARAASAASTANHTRAFASPSKLAMIERTVPVVPVVPVVPAVPASPAPASAGPAPVTLATRVVPTLPSVAAVAATAATAASTVTAASSAPGAPTAVIDDDPRSDMDDADQAEMARMAESVRRALNGEHDPGLVSTVDRSEVDGSVQAVLEIDADALEQITEDREPERDRGISSPRQGGSSSAPSRRQVELAVAATDQLIESLKRDEGVKRLSVRVVLRTADQREVEAEAEWESS